MSDIISNKARARGVRIGEMLDFRSNDPSDAARDDLITAGLDENGLYPDASIDELFTVHHNEPYFE